jgi:hypothetical protein
VIFLKPTPISSFFFTCSLLLPQLNSPSHIEDLGIGGKFSTDTQYSNFAFSVLLLQMTFASVSGAPSMHLYLD